MDADAQNVAGDAAAVPPTTTRVMVNGFEYAGGVQVPLVTFALKYLVTVMAAVV